MGVKNWQESSNSGGFDEMKFEHSEVFNFEGALRGMRNPLNSWSKSDSKITWEYGEMPRYEIGPNDMDLARRLIVGGSEHRKFLRQIMVSVDITAPLYWWKEFDTYKVGTTANSTSTMHKLASTPITLECFETDDYDGDLIYFDSDDSFLDVNDMTSSLIGDLESLRQKYNETKDKRYWKELIRWLPNGWLQTRTVTMNYENLRSMYHQRENHKLTEWHAFCDWVATLPYAKEFIID
jgi:hypothetical protein